MFANPPNHPAISTRDISIAWPVDLLLPTNSSQQIVGFLMRRVTEMYPIHEFYNPSSRRKKSPSFHYLYLYRTARNLASAVSALHAKGYVIGDVNESNILISTSALVTLVDTDSFQVDDPQHGVVHRCLVGKPEFTPPELQSQSFDQVVRVPEHDLFGLAVLIFQLLMEGTHPFDGKFQGSGEPPAKEKRIAEGHFVYGTRSVPYSPKPGAPPFDILPSTLQQLFVRCFEKGYNNPQVRPEPQTWVTALKEAENALITCSQNKQHLYGSHLRACPWCDRKKQLQGLEPFPPLSRRQASTPIQIPLPPAIPNSLGLGLPSVTLSQFPSQTTNTQKQPSSLPRTPTPPTPNIIAPRTVQPTTPISKGLITVGAAVLVGLAGYWYWISRPDPFIQATEIAKQAAELGKSAKTSDEWFALASQWKQASDMVASVQSDNQSYEVAQKRIVTYRQNGETALREAKKSSKKEFPSAVGIDYTKLRTLLTEQKWKDANEETTTIMIKIADQKLGVQTFGFNKKVQIFDIKKIPCKDLNTIDKLWVKYSNGRFGFSVQHSIWKSVGGQYNLPTNRVFFGGPSNLEVYNNFGKRIGWTYEDWLSGRVFKRADQLTFSLNSPPGHLPEGNQLSGGYAYQTNLGIGKSYPHQIHKAVRRVEDCGI
jgi:serine/threonine protein kinase